MKQFIKISVLLLTGAQYTTYCHAQWTAQDSLKLKKILERDGELKLNEEAVKSIDFNSVLFPNNQPMIHKNSLKFDMTLPGSPENRKEEIQPRSRLSLRPYKATTKYNYDPVYKKKISIDQKYRGDVSSLYRDGAPGTRRGPMNDTRLMMMNGTFSGSFRCDFDKILSKRYWDFRGRKNSRKTLEILKTYTDSVLLYHLNMIP